MILVVCVLLAAVVSLPLLGTATGRWLARRDHRCTVVTRWRVCEQCVAVVQGEADGGHVLCACGAASPHLVGTGLLAWRAEHHGERFPSLPTPSTLSTPHASTSGPAAEAREAEVAGVDPAGDAFVEMLEAMGDAERRAIVRARRRPDPLTPQVLREAGAQGTADDVDGSHADGSHAVDGTA